MPKRGSDDMTEPAELSAFAAKRQIQEKKPDESESHRDEEPGDWSTEPDEGDENDSLSYGIGSEESGAEEYGWEEMVSDDSDEEELDTKPPLTPSYKATGGTIMSEDSNGIRMALKQGEVVAILGEYYVKLIKGSAKIMGFNLELNDERRIYAPSTHSIPIIEATQSSDVSGETEIEILDSSSGLESLAKVSPLYRDIFLDSNKKSLIQRRVDGNREDPSLPGRRSFILMDRMNPDGLAQSIRNCGNADITELLKGRTDAELATSRTGCGMVDIPESWAEVLLTLKESLFIGRKDAAFAAEDTDSFQHQSLRDRQWQYDYDRDLRKRKVMVCGARHSGKSTFARILINVLLQAVEEPEDKPIPEVYFLDLDPGQPEFSPPGQISLFLMEDPTFGPNYSQPTAAGVRGRTLIRSHCLGAPTPRHDPHHYLDCICDLINQYDEAVNEKLSMETPALVINWPAWMFGSGQDVLLNALGTIMATDCVILGGDQYPYLCDHVSINDSNTELHCVQAFDAGMPIRTAAESRSMQLMSYFHLTKPEFGNLQWDNTPLTDLKPWTVKYAGNTSGIIGIMVYGLVPVPQFLHIVLNGSYVHIVVIEDEKALPPHRVSIDEHFQESGTSAFQHEGYKDLPYIFDYECTPLDPKYSRTIGLALVRSIDPDKRTLQLLTPLSHGTLQRLNETRKKVVLVLGKHDEPSWAYLEPLVAGFDKLPGDAAAGGADGQREIPWVESRGKPGNDAPVDATELSSASGGKELGSASDGKELGAASAGKDVEATK